ncbi:MAG: N-acetyltransferase [Merismopedia sp. SIO2A8]|nr:N-acetyltransferase [Merismopedia sp. SIO2A8]
MHIRAATYLDRDNVHGVHWSAFPESERELVAKLAIDLLGEETRPAILSLVAEADGIVVGHIAFSPVTVDDHENWQGYILAPLGVKPDYQKQRIGSTLIESSVQQLSDTGVNMIFVYGDPNYYGRFGFRAETANPYIAPYPLQYPFGWQAIALHNCNVEELPKKITCVHSLCDPALW